MTKTLNANIYCRIQPSINLILRVSYTSKISHNASFIAIISTIYILEVKNVCEKPLKLKREFGEIMRSIEHREYECKIC